MTGLAHVLIMSWNGALPLTGSSAAQQCFINLNYHFHNNNPLTHSYMSSWVRNSNAMERCHGELGGIAKRWEVTMAA